MRKRIIDEIEKRELLKMSEFAELNKVGYSMIKFYSYLGLLSFFRHNKRLAKYYFETSQRFEEILRLRQKWQTMADIILLKNKEL